MSRPQKMGLDYFPLDVDFLVKDRRIKALRARFGADGIEFYLYILGQIYGDKGYYLPSDVDVQDVAAADLGMSYEKIGQILNFLLERSLLDSTLFQSDKVLVSHGAQLRWQSAKESSARKTPLSVDGKFWILSKEETQSFIQVRQIDNNSRNNIDTSGKNCDNSEKNDTKKSKENKSKVNKKEDVFLAYADGDTALLSALQDFAQMRKEIRAPLTDRAKKMILTELDKLSTYNAEKVEILNQSVMKSWKGVFPLSGKRREQTREPNASYDIDEYERQTMFNDLKE